MTSGGALIPLTLSCEIIHATRLCTSRKWEHCGQLELPWITVHWQLRHQMATFGSGSASTMNTKKSSANKCLQPGHSLRSRRLRLALACLMLLFLIKKMKHVVLVIAGMLFFLHGTPVIADDILIVGNEYKPPKVYLEHGEPKGILVDIMRYIEQETGHRFTIQLYPWKRAYAMAENGEEGVIGLSMTKERLQIFDYSDVMYYDDMVLVVVKGHEFPFATIDDLAGKRVGVRRGSSYGDEFERGRKEIFEAEEDSNAIFRLKKLLAQRIDVALIGPGQAGLNQVLKDDPELFQRKDEFVILPTPFNRDPNYLGFAKSLNRQTLLQEVNQILRKGYEDGTIQRIIDRYSE
jgi:ABC-type amino acid transport substrate-binding protein